MNTIMTIEEVARYLKTSRFTVYRLIKEKAIPATRVGGQWRFHKDRVDEWFSSQCITRGEEKVRENILESVSP